MRFSLKTALTLTAVIVLGAALYWVSTYRILVNFHTVVPGKVYRSAQPFPEELEAWVKQYGLKSVINLRGAQRESKWYLEERALLKKMGVKLFNVGLNSHKVPHVRDLKKLMTAFAKAPTPLLIHCRVGADRTGEASALYKLIFEGISRAEAQKMLSPAYLHLPFLTPSKTFFLESFKGVEWALKEYDPCLKPFSNFYDAEWCKRGPLPKPSRTSQAAINVSAPLEFFETWNITEENFSGSDTIWDE